MKFIVKRKGQKDPKLRPHHLAKKERVTKTSINSGGSVGGALGCTLENIKEYSPKWYKYWSKNGFNIRQYRDNMGPSMIAVDYYDDIWIIEIETIGQLIELAKKESITSIYTSSVCAEIEMTIELQGNENYEYIDPALEKADADLIKAIGDYYEEERK